MIHIIDTIKGLEHSLNSFPSMLFKSYNTNYTCTLDEFITIFGKMFVYKVHVQVMQTVLRVAYLDQY